MRRIPLQQSPLFSTVVIMMTVLLLFSFGLHTFQVDHTHPGSHTADIHHADEKDASAYSEYLHGSEKKIFLMVLLGFLALGVFLVIKKKIILVCVTQLYYRARERRYLYCKPRRFDHTIDLFRQGILHSKAF